MINSFTGKYSFLSNFYPTKGIEYEGIVYLTVEHAYQAAKSLSPIERDYINRAPTPSAAKKAGRYLTLRTDWEEVKLEIMSTLLKSKYQWADLKLLLLETGDEELIEGNWWGDTYWGICRGVGENHLGKLLMEIRDSH